MKAVNLLSIVEGYLNMDEEIFDKYLDYLKISPKKEELKDLKLFTELLEKKSKSLDIFTDYFFGFTIPQISKEFDLIRIGENYVVNIELKRTSTIEKIKKQLIRNKYYLSFLDKNVLNFTFISNEKRLYRLDNNNNLIEETFKELSKILLRQKLSEIININNLFNPSNYLVSPFNSTDEFINNKYFLTGQQELIKNKILLSIGKNETTFISISGKAGTGKTLLTYDIAKEYKLKNTNVLIIHCGKLNGGHYKLRDEYKWHIISIKDLEIDNLYNYPIVIIDETQRIYPNQLLSIISQIKINKSNCIFSYDKLQCLRKWEINNNIEERIHNLTSSDKYQLTEKIRTNKEIASFILGILDNKKQISKFNKSNVELSYFKEYSKAKEYIKTLKRKGWKVINYTPSNRHNLPYDNFKIMEEDNAHEVIGQEFDNVVAVVDSHFYYNSKNKLDTRNYENRPYYHPTKMLLQIMTRTRMKLNFVVIDNDEIMERCLTILDEN